MSSSYLWQQNRSKHVCFYKKQYLIPILDSLLMHQPSELCRYRNFSNSKLAEITDRQYRLFMNCTFACQTKVLCNYVEGPDYIIVSSAYCEQNQTFLALTSVLDESKCFLHSVLHGRIVQNHLRSAIIREIHECEERADA